MTIDEALAVFGAALLAPQTPEQYVRAGRSLAAEVRRLREEHGILKIRENKLYETEAELLALRRKCDPRLSVTNGYRDDLAAARAEAARLKDSNDAYVAQFRNIGIAPYLDRMKELADKRDAAVAEAARLREAIQLVLDYDGPMHSADRAILRAALEVGT